MKYVLWFSLFSMLSFQTMARGFQIENPEQMVRCLENYIYKRIMHSASSVEWEHPPAFEYHGKYFSASWTSNLPSLSHGSLILLMGPNSQAPLYCDYPLDSTGYPDLEKGYCNALVENAEIIFKYRYFNQRSEQVNSQKRVARIIDSKIYCSQM